MHHTNREDSSISRDLCGVEESHVSSQPSPSHDFCMYRPNQGLLSPIANRLHKEVEESHVSSQWSPISQTNDNDIISSELTQRTRLGNQSFQLWIKCSIPIVFHLT